MASNTFFWYNPNAYFFGPDAYIYSPFVCYNCPYAYAQPAFNNQPSFNYNNSSQNTRYACCAGTACSYRNHAAGQRAIAASFHPNQNININTGVVGGRGWNNSSFANVSAMRHKMNERQSSFLKEMNAMRHKGIEMAMDNVRSC